MQRKVFLWLASSLWGCLIVITGSQQVNANTPLNRAQIQSLRNFVQLIPKTTRTKRPAKRSDMMTPGDGLATGRASLADLRFNDGSLARIGEQAVFQFLPRTRNFRLSNGTVLLLIPPGRGQTRIQTPSASAAIRGSALFVRYDQPTDTTIIGALTNSGIQVANQDASQTQELKAGQLLLLVKGKIQGLYDFDLNNFYETSDLVQGLDLPRKNLNSTTDPAIASVQAEIIAALAAQAPIIGEGVLDNPSFLQLTAKSDSEDSAIENLTNRSYNSVVDSLLDIGELLFNNAQEAANRDENITDNPPPNPPTHTPDPPEPPIKEDPGEPKNPPDHGEVDDGDPNSDDQNNGQVDNGGQNQGDDENTPKDNDNEDPGDENDE